MRKTDKIELRSEEMRDILTRPPHILIRSGISVICGIAILLLIGSFFFKYPDIVIGEITITTENPPVRLIAKATGKIKELNCSDKSEIYVGQILAIIENPAITGDVIRVKKHLLQCIVNDSSLFLPPDLLLSNYELGSMQNAYSSFAKAVTEYENFLSFNTTSKEKNALILKATGHGRYSSALQKQLELKEEELRIAQSVFMREQQLYEKGVVSKYELEIAESTFLNIKQTLQQIKTSIVSDQVESVQLNEAISKLDIQYLKERNSLFANLHSSYRELLSTIENWEQTYLLISPIDGVVTFSSFWAKNQFVNSGENVLTVVPLEAGEIVGRVRVQTSGVGKIRQDQRVNIKVHGFPYMEYGSLQGKVKNISLVSNQNSYSIEVELPKGLKTNTGHVLDFSGDLIGEAEIVTDDRSLFSRIFSPLKYLISNHIGG
ncbi:HlyD family secretion protein [Bacteroides sp. 51]|uniref:HlyD family secretion protein n=1 Tax=Bacteroides sp. 51 TaxID=2302938 RepID=UPI0013CFAAD4|nr:HlyD family efflux transporter periplasmic adaptor subunit [Bacteroides sp. 51]NDV83395.1 HlyD family efflux transporter periplasmic adaptor subunit [Bacteroides sp. 51]